MNKVFRMHFFQTLIVLGLCSWSMIGLGQTGEMSEREEKIYTFGVKLRTDLGGYGFSKAEMKVFLKGFKDAGEGNLLINPGKHMETLRQFLQQQIDHLVAEEAKKGAQFSQKFEIQSGVAKTSDGAVYKVLRRGQGKIPTPNSTVHVHFEGRLVTGEVFDSSKARRNPAASEAVEFPLRQMIPCWRSVLTLVPAGSEVEFVCPPTLAYGSQPVPPMIPAGASLIFKVDLVKVSP